MQYDPKASLNVTMYNNIVNKQKIHDIKQNASNLDDVLTFRVNGGFKERI